MTKLSFKAILAALVTSGLVVAGFVGVVAPAQAVATLTVTPSSSTIMGDGSYSTPSMTIVASNAVVTSGTYDVIQFGLIQMSDGTGLLPNSTCMSSPSVSNCYVTSIEHSAPGANSWSAISLMNFGVGDVGGRKFLRMMANNSIPQGDDIKLVLGAGAFSVGNYSTFQANTFDATIYKSASNYSIIEIFSSPGAIVRTQPPSLSVSYDLFSTSTTNPISTSSYTYTRAGFTGQVTYTTTINLTNYGYSFNGSTGQYERNSNPVVAFPQQTGSVIATDANNASASTSIRASISAPAMTLNFSGSNSLTGSTSSPPSSSGSLVVANNIGAVTYSTSMQIAGYTFDTQTGVFTRNSNAVTAGGGNVTITATDSTNQTANVNMSYSFSGGGGGSSIMFTATGSLTDSNGSPITELLPNTPVSAFTATASNPTNSATYNSIGVIFSTSSGSTQYFSVANPVNTMAQNPSAPTSWSPGQCGITAISVGGTALTGSSGATCQKQTWTFNSANAYAVRIYLASSTSATISVSVASGVFTSAGTGNYNFRLSLSGPSGGSYFTGIAPVPIAVVSSLSSPAPVTPAASAALSIGVSAGQPIAGAPVSISASGLQSSAPYEVVVRSTPQTLASGNAVNGAVSTSVTIPSGLEEGWHTLTFTSTGADGSAVTSVAYFKVSAAGTLLATSSTIPAELAYTGLSDVTKPWGEIALALMGFGILLYIRQRKRNA